MLSMKAYLNASEVARLLSVDRATVTRWIKKGIIRNAVRVGSGQQWRIPLASYEETAINKRHESH
jgi:excisionase family DNA binding protein